MDPNQIAELALLEVNHSTMKMKNLNRLRFNKKINLNQTIWKITNIKVNK